MLVFILFLVIQNVQLVALGQWVSLCNAGFGSHGIEVAPQEGFGAHPFA